MIRLERHRSLPSLQPFCPIIIKCTREVTIIPILMTMLIMMMSRRRSSVMMIMMMVDYHQHVQVAGFNSLADVLKRLDFTSAIRDVRRFQWVFFLFSLNLSSFLSLSLSLSLSPLTLSLSFQGHQFAFSFIYRSLTPSCLLWLHLNRPCVSLSLSSSSWWSSAQPRINITKLSSYISAKIVVTVIS